MGYVSSRGTLSYLEEHLEKMFSKKEVKYHKKELLQEVSKLMKECDFISDSKLLSVLIFDSYLNYKELLNQNSQVRKFYDFSYHKTYIHARYCSIYCYSEGSIESQLEQELEQYYEKYSKEKPVLMPMEHYRHITKLAFLNEKIERLGIKKKKLKTLSVDQANLIKEWKLEKALLI